jgi:SAM-dependent methyltransferase
VTSPGDPSRKDGGVGRSDPATVERIWGQRIETMAEGYGGEYSAERRVDERLLERALSVSPQAPGVALDVGTFYPETPKRLAREGWVVVCADLSEEVCRRVRRFAVQRRVPLTPVRCDAAALPFRSGVFDLVTDFATSVVMPNPEAAVGEEVRVLKPGGRYVLVTSNRWTRSGRANIRRQRAAGGRHPRWGYFSPLSPWELWAIARHHGLMLIAVDSEVHSLGVVGPLLTGLCWLLPPLRRFCGWRLGAAYLGEGVTTRA